ncbi:MAG: DUF4214 domain-containing protein [Pseudomonadales bacterium]|nr:DUF4214 domain-containing protein [Pseudomonadales bacterium]
MLSFTARGDRSRIGKAGFRAGNWTCLAVLLGCVWGAQNAVAQCTERSFSAAEQQVINAYIGYYGRAPDYAGFAYWSQVLTDEGGSLGSIIEDFGNSAEFESRFGSLSNTELVNNLFQQVFGRDADPLGLEFYTNELSSGARTLQNITLDILGGAQNDDKVIADNRAAVAGHYVILSSEAETNIDSDTLFSLLGAVGSDTNSATSACSTVSGFYSDAGETSVASTLSKLSIDTTPTPRVDQSGNDLPSDYAPLGASRTLERKAELFLAGLPRLNQSDSLSLLKYLPAGAGQDASTAHMPGASLDESWKQSAYNAVAPGDIDGDGFEEMVFLWWNAGTGAVTLTVMDDESENFTYSAPSVLIAGTPDYLQVITGDLDGDGTDNVIVAIIDDSSGRVNLNVLSGSKSAGFALSSNSVEFSASQSSSDLSIEMAAGQLDRDAGLELAVVTSETVGGGQNGSPGGGQSRYWIYDDLNAGFELKHNDRISAFIDTATIDGVTGTLAVGDVDGDNLDEIVIAALADHFPTTCEPVTTLQLVLDDMVNGNATVASSQYSNRLNNCESSGNNGWTSYVWADVLDIDGDGYQEFHVNGVVFDDLFNTSSLTPMEMDGETIQIPTSNVFKGPGNNQRVRTTRENTVLTVGDVTADGYDDIIVYMPATVPLRQVSNGAVTFWENGYAVTVWGFDPASGEWGQKYYEELDGQHLSEDEFGPPQLAAVNVDNDSTLLKYSEGTHEIVFTEPLVLAALAAPPCWGDGVQVTDVCQTSWGKGSTVGASSSVSHEVTARQHSSVSADVSLPIIGDVGVEVSRSVGVSLGVEASLGYQTSKTITYTTGAMEDTVVATVIPYDQYTYKILSHPVYPQLVGTDLVISLPRAPRTIQIERQFFNSAVSGEGVQVGSNVFGHTIGDVSTYPSRSDMQSILGFLGSSIGPVDVGASNGSTSVEISESLTAGLTTSVSVSYEREVKTDLGKSMVGFSVGSSTTASLGFSVGSDVVFAGTVGDMPPETFSLDRAYSYGLFAYQLTDSNSGQTFQVINYWVE